MKTVLSLIVLSIIVSGCYSSTLVTPSGEKGDLSYPEFNAKFGNDEANINFKDGRKLSGNGYYASHDSISWNDPDTHGRTSAPLESVRDVGTVSHTSSALLGLLVGAAAGVGVSLSVTSGPSDGGEGVVWAIAPPGGAVFGAVVGALIGSHSRYEFAGDTTSTQSGGKK